MSKFKFQILQILYFSTCGKSRCGEAKKFELEFKGQEINKIGKSTSGEAKKFEFEFGKK